MKSIAITIIVSLMSGMIGALGFYYIKGGSQTTAYVHTKILVEKYKGMEETKVLFQKKVNEWESTLDTLSFDYKRAADNYLANKKLLSDEDQKNQESILQRQYENLLEYQEKVDSRAIEEEQQMLAAVLQQVNDAIKTYGEAHGYDIILGSTSSGSLMYGREQMDITDDVLKEINAIYSGK